MCCYENNYPCITGDAICSDIVDSDMECQIQQHPLCGKSFGRTEAIPGQWGHMTIT